VHPAPVISSLIRSYLTEACLMSTFPISAISNLQVSLSQV